MEYLKYLVKHPGKLGWNLLVLVMCGLFAAGIVSDRDAIIYNSSEFVYAAILVGLTATAAIGLYQPYVEWRDRK